ncbi:MAG: hypothetical protein NZT92_04460 [Abditibacteriales bacterium]|nr:hypothetical protein [Abditibacteriales bacterium]MDW8364500.1 hypothetical protein [Abditibacteriales bacterium]
MFRRNVVDYNGIRRGGASLPAVLLNYPHYLKLRVVQPCRLPPLCKDTLTT